MALKHMSPKTHKLERCTGNCKYGKGTAHINTQNTLQQVFASEAAQEDRRRSEFISAELDKEAYKAFAAKYAKTDERLEKLSITPEGVSNVNVNELTYEEKWGQYNGYNDVTIDSNLEINFAEVSLDDAVAARSTGMSVIFKDTMNDVEGWTNKVQFSNWTQGGDGLQVHTGVFTTTPLPVSSARANQRNIKAMIQTEEEKSEKLSRPIRAARQRNNILRFQP